MGSSDVDMLGDLAMTADNNALSLTGFYHDQADFGNITLGSQGDTDMFVAKVNPSDGVTFWAKGSGWAGKRCGLAGRDCGNRRYGRCVRCRNFQSDQPDLDPGLQAVIATMGGLYCDGYVLQLTGAGAS